MIRLALRMGAIFAPRSALHGLAIRAGFRMLGIWPAARSYFAEDEVQAAARFNSGFLLKDQLARVGSWPDASAAAPARQIWRHDARHAGWRRIRAARHRH